MIDPAEAVRLIDAALPGTTDRNLIPSDEVQTLLLDLRLCFMDLTEPEPVLA